MISNNNNLNDNNKKDSLLPPPEILVKYEELGIGEDLINLIKKEQEHRHILQNKYFRVYLFGQILGFLTFLLFIYEIFKLVRIDYIREAYIMFGLFASYIKIR